MNRTTHSPLRYLFPGWFAIPMGLAGLALAWHRAVPLMGDAADAAALGLGVVAAAVFAVLALATVGRVMHHRAAWAEDCRHPVRHTFIAAMPIGVLLLATVGVALFGPLPALWVLWWAGSLAQWFVTWWVLSRWWQGPQGGGLQWASVTPALFIPIVGNVLVPLAGMPLGATEWAAAQFGVGLVFWPLVMALLLVRLAQQGLWAERLLPAAFILIAPPAVVGLSLLQLGAPAWLAWACWGIAVFFAFWCLRLGKRIAALPFGLPHWAMSFPLAALAALSLRLSDGSFAMRIFATAALALVSLVIGALVLATVRGLREGSLLAPEPAAPIVPQGSATIAANT